MTKTLTIMLMSGNGDRDEECVAGRLAEAALARNVRVNIFLCGDGVALAKGPGGGPVEPRASKEHAGDGPASCAGGLMERVARMGAVVTSCRTDEHARGIASLPYRDGVRAGEMGLALCDFLLTSDVLLVLGS